MADGCVGYFESWKAVDGHLCIGGVDIPQIADSFGTPLYVYDAEAIRRNYHALAKSLSAFTIAYSVKANPSVGICRLLESLGCWAEVASGGEMLIARTAGFPQSHIMFAGPAKEESELQQACNEKVGIVKVESLRELELLASWASRGNPVPPSVYESILVNRFPVQEKLWQEGQAVSDWTRRSFLLCFGNTAPN